MLTLKWNNGFWKLFDTRSFRDVGIFSLRSEAAKRLKAGTVK